MPRNPSGTYHPEPTFPALVPILASLCRRQGHPPASSPWPPHPLPPPEPVSITSGLPRLCLCFGRVGAPDAACVPRILPLPGIGLPWQRATPRLFLLELVPVAPPRPRFIAAA